MSRVRDLSAALLKSPKYVEVDAVRAAEVAHTLGDVALEIPTWDFDPFYPQTDDFEEMCLFYLIFNSINYCYFDQYYHKFQDEETGYSGSTLAGFRLTQAWNEIKNPSFLKNVDETYLLSDLFFADSPISMVKERTHALRELGEFFHRETDFTFEKLFLKYHKNAYHVSQAIPVMFPSWRDPFAKRSQLFVGMTYGKFQDTDLIDVKSLQDLTVFADYRVPQTLIAMGIINPNAELLSKINAKKPIYPQSRTELELRAATIIGTDVLTEALNELREEDVNVLHTDYLLWSAGRKREKMPADTFRRMWPNHHLTITTDY